jgi:hypothetical protein
LIYHPSAIRSFMFKYHQSFKVSIEFHQISLIFQTLELP